MDNQSFYRFTHIAILAACLTCLIGISARIDTTNKFIELQIRIAVEGVSGDTNG